MGSPGRGRGSLDLPLKFHIECTKSHVQGPVGGRDIAISIILLAIARLSIAPSLASRSPLARSPLALEEGETGVDGDGASGELMPAEPSHPGEV